MTSKDVRISPGVALLPALAFLLLAVLQPPEIYPHVRAAFGLLVPLSLLSCLAAGRRAAARFEAAGPFLAGCAGFLAINGYLALQQHGAVVAAERLALAAAAFLVFRELADEPSLIAGRRLDGRTCVFLALAAAGCAASLVALWQWTYGFQMMAEAVPETGFPFREEVLARIASGRVFGTVLLPGSLAGLLGLTLPVTLSFALRAEAGGVWRGWARKSTVVCAAVLQGAALAASGSLAGCAALLLAAGATGWLAARSRMSKLVLASGAALIGIGSIAAAAHWRGIHWMHLSDPAHPAGQRLGNWIAGLRMLAERPLLGAGGGGYAALYPLYRQPWMNESRHAHNSYLELAVDYGPLALAAVVLFLVSACRRWLRACRSGPAAAAAAVGVPAFLLHNAVDFTAYQPGILVPFAALAGAIWAGPSGPQPQGAVRRRPSRAALAAILITAAGLLAAHAVADGFCGLLLERAEALKARGESAGALEALREAGRLSPLNPSPPAREAAMLLGSGDPREALSAARRASRLDPRSAALQYLVGSALLKAGDPAQAYVRFACAERLYPMHTDYTSARKQLEERIEQAGKEAGR